MKGSQGLYLGREVDPKAKALGARLELDPSDLLTHGLIVGMTGSGKTGLAIALIEEVLRQGVPVLAIDPKGDLGNLLLLFDGLDAESFEPWIDPEAARREGKDLKEAAEDTASLWKKGLADWGLSGADIKALRQAHDAVIFTPGSRAGVPLDILQSLEAPSIAFDAAEEDLRDEIEGIVAGLLGLVHVDADPLQSKESVFLSNLIEQAWRAGKGYTLESLIGAVADPPFDKVGALPLESVYPRKERQTLMMALNNLLAAPSFAAWLEGEPLDIEGLLKAKNGKPRLSVVYTAHLSDEERLFVTALLLDKVKTWMRRQRGTQEMRALIYIDEIFGYFPPSANPPTKRPLLTLLKQARAQGVGVMLATQNPVDLDYRGLANMGTWMVGKLQTERDRARLQDGLTGAGVDQKAAGRLLDATGKRVFLLHDVHRGKPCLLQSRWAMSYLRGPLTREEVGRLMKDGEKGPASAAKPVGGEAGASSSAAPVLPAPFKSSYFKKYGGELADAHLLVKYAVRYKGTGETVAVKAWPLAGASPAEVLEAEPLEVDEAAVTIDAPSDVRYGDLPEYIVSAGAKGLEKALKDRLPDKLVVKLFYDPQTKTSSAPGEARDEFAARLASAGGGDAASKLREKLEKKKRDLALREQEVAGRKTEKWVAVGAAVLKNIGLFMGKKHAISGAEGVLSKNRMENNAEARADALRAEVAAFEQELQALAAADPERFEAKDLVPGKSDVKLLRYDVLWVY